MKVIDLINKIANGDISEDTLIEFDNGYKDYCSIRMFFDRYIMDRENLNCDVKAIDVKKPKTINDIRESYGLPRIEDKRIERLQWCNIKGDSTKAQLLELKENAMLQFEKINELINYLNKGE